MLDFRTNTFLTVCETMNFTEAAKRLNITQPAVSQHIRFLENEYNTQLFLYHNKQLYITQTGKILTSRYEFTYSFWEYVTVAFVIR